MKRIFPIFLFIGLVWGQDSLKKESDFDKLVSKSGTIYLGEYSRIEKNIVYFKTAKAMASQGVPLNKVHTLQLSDGTIIINNGEINKIDLNNKQDRKLIFKEDKELKVDNKVLIKNGYWEIEPEGIKPYGGAFIDIEQLNKKKVSIREKAVIDAKNNSYKWVLYPPSAFLTFGAIMLGSQEEPWESFPATIGISAASLTIPYLFFREATWINNENLSPRDKKLYEKVYSKELRKRKSTIIFTSSVVTGLLGPLLYISAVVAGLSF